jgi:hypothetical protein
MWGTNKIIRIKCPNCDTIFGSITVMNMDYEKLSYCYSLVYSFFVEGDTANAQLNLFYKLKPIKNKKYLNYACGDWKGIEQIISADYDIYGYDPVISYNNTKILKNINQIPKQLDGLFSNNYIEHLQNPINQFIEWNNMLKLGSIMIHSGEYDYNTEKTNFHLLYLSEKGLQILCDKTGFEIINSENRKTIEFKKIFEIKPLGLG